VHIGLVGQGLLGHRLSGSLADAGLRDVQAPLLCEAPRPAGDRMHVSGVLAGKSAGALSLVAPGSRARTADRRQRSSTVRDNSKRQATRRRCRPLCTICTNPASNTCAAPVCPGPARPAALLAQAGPAAGSAGAATDGPAGARELSGSAAGPGWQPG
jgi:hypothetical protein